MAIWVVEVVWTGRRVRYSSAAPVERSVAGDD